MSAFDLDLETLHLEDDLSSGAEDDDVAIRKGLFASNGWSAEVETQSFDLGTISTENAAIEGSMKMAGVSRPKRGLSPISWADSPPPPPCSSDWHVDDTECGSVYEDALSEVIVPQVTSGRKTEKKRLKMRAFNKRKMEEKRNAVAVRRTRLARVDEPAPQDGIVRRQGATGSESRKGRLCHKGASTSHSGGCSPPGSRGTSLGELEVDSRIRAVKEELKLLHRIKVKTSELASLKRLHGEQSIALHNQLPASPKKGSVFDRLGVKPKSIWPKTEGWHKNTKLHTERKSRRVPPPISKSDSIAFPSRRRKRTRSRRSVLLPVDEMLHYGDEVEVLRPRGPTDPGWEADIQLDRTRALMLKAKKLRTKSF